MVLWMFMSNILSFADHKLWKIYVFICCHAIAHFIKKLLHNCVFLNIFVVIQNYQHYTVNDSQRCFHIKTTKLVSLKVGCHKCATCKTARSISIPPILIKIFKLLQKRNRSAIFMVEAGDWSSTFTSINQIHGVTCQHTTILKFIQYQETHNLIQWILFSVTRACLPQSYIYSDCGLHHCDIP